MAMTPRTTSDMVPAPAITAGMVNTPVPTMLPMTSPVAEVSPREWALAWFRGDTGRSGGVVGVGVGLPWAMAMGLTCLLEPDGGPVAYCVIVACRSGDEPGPKGPTGTDVGPALCQPGDERPSGSAWVGPGARPGSRW